MLTTASPLGAGRARHPALLALLWPSARHVRPARVAVTVAIGGVPLAAQVATAATPSTVPVALLAVASGAAVAWAVDDPAVELFSACPIGSPRRTQVRMLLAAVTAAVAFVAIVGAAASWRGDDLITRGRLAEGAAAGAAGVAAALLAWRRGDPFGGITGVCVGLIGPFAVSALSVRWPAAFPALAAGSPHDGWWVVAAAAGMLAANAGRDPGTAARSAAIGALVRRGRA